MKRSLWVFSVLVLVGKGTASAAEGLQAERAGPSLEYHPPRPVLPEPKGPTPAPPVTIFREVIGRFGISTEAFDGPVDAALDSSGNIYVLDSGNNRVQIFDKYLNFVLAFGSYGSREGEFNKPSAIALDDRGFLYVVDSGNHRVQIFTSDLKANKITFYESWGSLGSREGEFKDPTDIALDGSGAIWIVDSGNDRVQRFTFQRDLRHGPRVSPAGGFGRYFGDRQGTYEDLVSISWSDEDLGYLYLLSGSCLVQQFRLDGTFWKSWPAVAPESGLCVPGRIRVDNKPGQACVYVLDAGNGLLSRFSRDGRFLAALRGAERPFSSPRGFSFLPDRDQFVVADTANNIVQRFTLR